jgi:6-phosphogluconolactonase
MKPEIIRTRSFAEASSFIVHAAEEAIEEHGFFRVALSGGSTPRMVYRALGLRDCRWQKWIITFGDERCIPPDDPQKESVVGKVLEGGHGYPAEGVHPEKGELVWLLGQK